MWRLLLLGSAACWTPQVPARVAPPADARCEIRDVGVETADAVTLMVGGITFARITDKLARFDVFLEGRRGRAHLETETVELLSDLELSGFALRTRTSDLYDGWLAISHAFVEQPRRTLVEVAVPLPPGVSPRVFIAAVPCASVTFAIGSEEAYEGMNEGWFAFEPGTSTPLAKTPGGPVLVQLVPTAGTPVHARVLARSHGFARVKVVASNTIIGWVPTVHAREVPSEAEGGFGFGRSGDGRRTTRCPHDVRIYVDTGAKVHDVGRYKANALIHFDGAGIDGPDVTADDPFIPVDLGSGEIRPRVKRADIARCMPD